MEYRIIRNDSLTELSEKVNSLIKEGWEPLGGVSITVIYNSNKLKFFHISDQYQLYKFYQTMIKK